MSKVSLNGHTLSLKVTDWNGVLHHLQQSGPFSQISITEEDGVFVISRPLPQEERGSYAHLYHRQNRKPGSDPTKPKGPGGSGPKGGGTPGAGRQVEYTQTEAIAA